MSSYIDPWNKKLAKVREARAAGKVVWFRREDFHDPDFKETSPKWHIAKDRKPDPNPERTHVYDWVALCGYKHKFWEILYDIPRLRIGTAPKVADRCTKCDAKSKKTKKAIRVLVGPIHTRSKTPAAP